MHVCILGHGMQSVDKYNYLFCCYPLFINTTLSLEHLLVDDFRIIPAD